MSKGTRATLCSYFAEGEMPAPEHFQELIHAMLHMEEEGFSKTPDHGFEVTSAVGSPSLITFYRGGLQRDPQWTMAFGSQQRLDLLPGDKDTAPLLTLGRDRQVGVGTSEPQHLLHVDGVVGSKARHGTRPLPKADKPRLADGEWHPITEVLDGCVALEVVACATAPGHDRHALLHAVVLNSYNPVLGRWLGERLGGWVDRHLNRRKRIRAQCAWRSRRCDRLELAWQAAKQGNGYQLALRSMCDYGVRTELQVHITELWPARPTKAAP